jgi:hypothetical protein
MTLIFRHPFVLDGFDYALPAGIYTVETVEELLQGLSFPAYRWLASSIRIPPRPGSRTLVEVVGTNPAELDAALVRDAASPR